MPPTPNTVYNWACVLHSAGDIISRGGQVRLSQLSAHAPVIRTRTGQPPPQYAPNTEPAHVDKEVPSAPVFSESLNGNQVPRASLKTQSTASPLSGYSLPRGSSVQHQFSLASDVVVLPRSNPTVVSNDQEDPFPTNPRGPAASLSPELKHSDPIIPTPETSGSSMTSNASATLPELSGNNIADAAVLNEVPESTSESPVVTRSLQSAKLPSSRIGRFFHYGSLAASLGYGAAAEVLRRSTGSSNESDSPVIMTEANIKRLVMKLSEMRGAALKLGQFLSIQDTHILPPEVDKIFRRVQDSAFYMPDWQMEQVLTGSLGPDYASYFVSFERIPFAAASIGQVHRARLSAAASPTGREEDVAVKIQFPNVANSIKSDLGYIKLLLTGSKVLPKGLFLDRTIQVLGAELADECNYSREASYLRQFSENLKEDNRFKVPWVWDKSTEQVLVMEYVNGVSVGENAVGSLGQEDRNEIAATVIELCLKELFEFRAMQTDPNWTNFLWNGRTRQIELVDFGATRSYTKTFMDSWLRLLQAAASGSREECIAESQKLGYLTGAESEAMLDAHVQSMTLLATPFKAETPMPYSFAHGSDWGEATRQIRELIPVMLRERLTPPPRETYSLNRKLSGVFLLAARLGASVDTKFLWDKVVGQYQFDSESS